MQESIKKVILGVATTGLILGAVTIGNTTNEARIASVGPIPRQSMKDFDIEVQEINKINNGVEVFVRAWAKPQGSDVVRDTTTKHFKGNSRIGFGHDGTVEIERIRIINPPILVPDGTFTDEVIINPLGKEVTIKRPNYIEDPEKALKIAVEDTVRIIAKDDKNIVSGKVGNTTTTVYSDAGDNSLRKDDATWSTARGATDADSEQQTTASLYMANALEPGIYDIYVPFIMFDTSGISASDTISAATFSLYLGGDNYGNGTTDTYNVVSATQATWNDPILADFDQRTSTELATRVVMPATGATTGYKDWTLNATGRANIARSGETIPASASATGKTQFAMRGNYDLDNSAPGGFVGIYLIYMADQAGTTNDPKLVVEHALAPARTYSSIIWFD